MSGAGWSPDTIKTRAEFFAALREMKKRRGVGYPRLAADARQLLQQSPDDPRQDLGDRRTLNRVMKEAEWRWFSKSPSRLEVFLEVVNCPADRRAAWQEKFRELDERDDEATRRGFSRRRIILLATGVIAAIVAVYLVILARFVEFYNTLGVSYWELPLGGSRLIAATTVVFLIIAVIVIIAGGAYSIGAILVPHSTVPTALAMPIAAMSFTLFAVGYIGMIYISVYAGRLFPAAADLSDEATQLPVLLFGLAWLGSNFRLIAKQNTAGVMSGNFIGLAIGVLLAGSALGIPHEVAPRPFSPLVVLVEMAVIISGLGRWVRRQRRRAGIDRDDEVSPMTLLARLKGDLLPSAKDFAPAMPRREARKVAIGLLALAILLPILLVAFVLYLVSGAVGAAHAVLKYGYLPPARSSFALPQSVRPVTIVLRARGVDPIGVCANRPARAASLITQNSAAGWVLLRPVQPKAGSADVVRLPTSDYIVRFLPDPQISKDKPWTRPACGP